MQAIIKAFTIDPLERETNRDKPNTAMAVYSGEAK
jgi:hypothetical protein